ncbi:MAG TPA: shikimate kinase [Acidobacteriaceae bacterium]
MSTTTLLDAPERAGAPSAATPDTSSFSVDSTRNSIKSDLMRHTATQLEPQPLPAVLPGDLRRIVLTGFMGAGKTTVGRQLAAELGWEFLDLDTMIEARTGISVPRIFAEKGEAAFRRIESLALAVALGRKYIVLALGGGTPELLTNRLLLEQTPRTLTVYLHAPLSVLTARCLSQQDAVERPVLADPSEAERRFAQRLPHYQRLAGIIIDTSAATATEAAVILQKHVTAAK